ncbi:MAG: cell division topological specificity factor MinE [Bdellovibrionales bacterium]|nr:cell division topological specificity factor MinE [Bdellovibrionales bacterium]
MLAGIKKILFGGAESKTRAKSRLHFVLVQDRTGLSPDQMSKFKEELIDVIGNYFIIDKQGFDVSYQREEGSTTLLINSPVVVRRQDTPNGAVGSSPTKKAKKKAAAV